MPSSTPLMDGQEADVPVSPVTWRPADPQLQTRGSNKSSDQAMRSLERLQGVESGLVLPGHGAPWRDGVEAAVASAQRIGCRQSRHPSGASGRGSP